MQPVISLKNILVKKGENFSLSVESLALQPGLIYALTGPNGAGKSTLLRVMALLETPQTGSIVFVGNGQANPVRQRQKVTLVEQSPYLFKGSVADNLNYGLKLRGVDSNERASRVKSTLTNVGLEGFEERQAKELSGGEVQRVALARALVLKPELLLLDEPAAGLNMHETAEMAKLITRIRDRGMTVLVVEHDMSLVMNISDEIMVLSYGEKIAEDVPLGIQKNEEVVRVYLGEEDADEVSNHA